jgi:hypothetical protein
MGSDCCQYMVAMVTLTLEMPFLELKETNFQLFDIVF